MSVETTVVYRRYEVTVQVHVTGADTRRVPYTRDQAYLPRRVKIVYRGADADTDQTADVTLYGPRVLRYEAIGMVKSEPLSREAWPNWVSDLVEAHRPPADAFVRSTL